jgi:hypothetical protein
MRVYDVASNICLPLAWVDGLTAVGGAETGMLPSV